MADFQHEVTIAADAETVRKLLAERGDAWWTTNAVINPAPGGFCEFRFPSAGFHAALRVKANQAGLVEWWCVDSQNARSAGFKDLRDWVGSTIRFEIEAKGPTETELRLTHSGLGESAEYYRTGFNVWGFYMDSLKDLAETGKGDPYQGGEPGAQGVGVTALMVSFTIREGALEAAEAAIGDFIDEIERHEAAGTLVYRAYQDPQNARDFIHYMVFGDAAAHQAHRDSAYCARFVSRLYPLCVSVPRPLPLALCREAALG